MPKEYRECVKSYVAKGKPLKDAKRICAISYYKKHGETPEQAEKRGVASFNEYELNLFKIIPLIDEAFGTKRLEKTKKQQK